MKTSFMKYAWETIIGEKPPFVFLSERMEGKIGPWSRGQVFDTLRDYLAEIEATPDGFKKLNELLVRTAYKYTVLDVLANYALREISLI